jgi:hypothetical protein
MLVLRSILVRGIDSLESQRGDGAADKISDQEYPDIGPVEEAHDGDAKCYARIEGAAGNVSYCEGAGHDGHTDGEAVKGIVGSSLGGGHVQHYVDQREGEQKFREQSGNNLRRAGGDGYAGFEEFNDGSGDSGADELGNQ